MSSLLKENRKLMEEYDYENNRDIDLDSITIFSNKKVAWVCKKCGYKWKTSVSNRSYGKGCYLCGRKKTVKALQKKAAKKHNLVENYPYLKEEWDYEKNYPLKPEEFGYGSERIVYWICPWCGNSFSKAINKRTLRGYGCSICNNYKSTSFPEQVIYFYSKKIDKETVNRDTSMGVEFDVYLPNRKVAIEYDGSHWHNSDKSLLRENIKDDFCEKNGIKIIRIRNKILPKTSKAKIVEYNENDIKSLNNSVEKMLRLIDSKCNIKVDIGKDTYDILKAYRTNLKENSLEYKYPEIAKMWDYKNNKNLSPSSIFPNSTIKYWWICPKCNNSYQSSANHIVRLDRLVKTCPKCSIKRINKNNQIKIVNVDLNIIYDSLTAAAKSVNGRKADICSVCNGKRKTAFGYHWKYLDDNKRRRKNITGRILNVDTGVIYENSIEAAKSVNGDSRMINRCCRGEIQTSYGYHWENIS